MLFRSCPVAVTHQNETCFYLIGPDMLRSLLAGSPSGAGETLELPAPLAQVTRQEPLFQQVADPRFVITEIIQDADTAVLIWVFSFAAQKGSHAAAKTNASTARNSVRAERTEVRGASHLRFDSHGKIIWHRDYWDTAEELYAKIPILGAVMRFLKRRLATPQ